MKDKYVKLKEKFEVLELQVKSALIKEIEKNGVESDHVLTKVIKVNVFDYMELTFYDERLTFLDRNGYHYSLYAECTMEDLLDILIKID